MAAVKRSSCVSCVLSQEGEKSITVAGAVTAKPREVLSGGPKIRLDLMLVGDDALPLRKIFVLKGSR